jgi:hypothetical protein
MGLAPEYGPNHHWTDEEREYSSILPYTTLWLLTFHAKIPLCHLALVRKSAC